MHEEAAFPRGLRIREHRQTHFGKGGRSAKGLFGAETPTPGAVSLHPHTPPHPSWREVEILEAVAAGFELSAWSRWLPELVGPKVSELF